MTDFDPKRSRWIPWAFVGAFAVLVIANGFLIVFALTTFGGTVAENPFKRGNIFNEIRAERDAQDALGWASKVDFQATGPAQGRLVLSLTEEDGAPITNAQVSAILMHRSLEDGGRIQTALPYAGEGRYAGLLDLPAAGRWTVHVDARRGETPYREAIDIFVKP